MKVCLSLLLVFGLAFADQDIEKFAEGIQQFTATAYNQMKLLNEQNFLVSPFSADAAFSLTQSGAKGATAKELRNAFHLPSTTEEVESGFKSILPTIQSDYITLTVANKIYVENNFVLKDTFKTVATEVYQADFQNIAFEESEAAAEEINKWAEEQTNGKITDLMSPDDLDASTKIVLANALYFNGNWSVPFNPYFTNTSRFFTDAVNTVDAQIMYQESERYNWAEDETLDAQILEIPFQGEEASMIFVLPNKVDGLGLVEENIDTALSDVTFTQEYVQVQLPKFKIATMTDFKRFLQSLGVKTPFDASQADFSGIAGEPGQLFIAQAKQKTYIDVSEIGVEAAAVTEIGGNYNMIQPATKFFIADHPFIFYLKVNDVIVFEGRVTVPEYN